MLDAASAAAAATSPGSMGARPAASRSAQFKQALLSCVMFPGNVGLDGSTQIFVLLNQYLQIFLNGIRKVSAKHKLHDVHMMVKYRNDT